MSILSGALLSLGLILPFAALLWVHWLATERRIKKREALRERRRDHVAMVLAFEHKSGSKL